MNKKIFIRVVSFLSFMIMVISILIIKEQKYSEKLESQVVGEYQNSYAELNEKLENINILLKKAVYATSSQKIALLSTEIYSETKQAIKTLDKLSGEKESHKILNRFLSQAGEYSLLISEELTVRDTEITAQQQRNLRILSDFASLISETVSESHIDSENLSFWVTELTDEVRKDNIENFDNELNKIESSIEEYPDIIYDGTNSDYIEKPEPEMLKNEDEITVSKANETANKIFNSQLYPDGEFEENFIEGYNFTNGNYTVKISKKGGILVAFYKNKDVNERKLSYEQVLLRAERFIEDKAYSNMRAIYHRIENNICIINFAFVDGQTLCYTDLIKVGVALDNGEIVLFEALEYIANHKNRVFESLGTTEEDARAVLPVSLTVKSSAIALIPTEALKEVRCYEFICSGYDNEDVLVFVNVSNLETEEIFILSQDKNGTIIR